MALAESLLKTVLEEMEKRGACRLHRVNVCCGLLSNVVPESLELAFEAVMRAEAAKPRAGGGQDIASARLEIEELPAVLRCNACRQEFSTDRQGGVFSACSACGNRLGHTIVSGTELYLKSMEIS